VYYKLKLTHLDLSHSKPTNKGASWSYRTCREHVPDTAIKVSAHA